MTGVGGGSRPLLGVLLILGTVCCFAALDTSVRWLGAMMPVLLLLTARYAFQVVAMGLWLALDRRLSFRSAHPRFQALRGALLLATSGFSFYGLQHMPVAEFTSILMLTPVLVTLLSALVLREAVSRWRLALVFGAFAGALIVIRPGSGLFGWAVFYPLAATAAYAAFQLLTSRLAVLEHPLTTHFWTGFVGTALLLPLLLVSAIDVPAAVAAASPRQLAVALAIGVFGTGGHLMLILALGLAPAATLMPFLYLQIGAAAALGYAVFGRLPDAWGWIGMGIVGACGAATAWLNLRAAARPLSPVTADSIAD